MRTQVTHRYENKVVRQHSAENKASFIPNYKGFGSRNGFQTIDLEAETSHSCRKTDYVK